VIATPAPREKRGVLTPKIPGPGWHMEDDGDGDYDLVHRNGDRVPLWLLEQAGWMVVPDENPRPKAQKRKKKQP